MYEVYLKKNEEKRIIEGHPWIYANEVFKIENTDGAKNGSLASVYSYDNRFIGKGYINHASKILVRLFIRSSDKEDDKNYYLEAIKNADDYRKRIGFDNSYRMIYSESDNIPGLIVDKYDDILVMQCLSLGIDKRKKMIADCLVELFSPRGIYERSDVSVRKKEGLDETKGVLYGEVPDNVTIYENGLMISVDVKNGQKTGYYLDQKENRYSVRRYCDGEILDCFCNIGGFALNAALSANKVTACDISEIALDGVMKNAYNNGLDNIVVECGDVFEILRTYRKEKRIFDTVILDPPAFCKSYEDVKNAYKGYKDINLNAMKLVKSGGFLITCSCSHYMSEQLFEKMLRESAKDAGKIARIVEKRTQAGDHPQNLFVDESSYLKFYILNII